MHVSTAPRPSDPPVQRIRFRYAKRGRLRFASHRDVARAFERALRAAGVPVAFSQGFSPHPRISWIGSAAPTGAASEAEYAELQVTRRLDAQLLRRELDAALPDGLSVLAAQESAGGSLAEQIDASRWRIELPGVPPQRLQVAVAALLAAPEVLVQKLTKDGRRTIDARAAIVSACVQDAAGDCGILSIVVRQVTPAVRPDDVMSALFVVAGVKPTVPALATRTAQGRLDDDGRIVDPLQHVGG